MNSMAKAIISIFLIACLFAIAPADTQSQALELPLTKSLQPGTHEIVYGGQTLKFETQVALQVRLYYVGLVRFQIAFKKHPYAGGGGGGAAATEWVALTWEEYNETMYDDDAPDDEWIGEIDTSGEGGWVER